MSWKGFFEAIQSTTEAILLNPLDGLRALELNHWAMANILNWIFMLIGMVAFIYWMKQLKNYNDDGSEDRSSTSHQFLG